MRILKLIAIVSTASWLLAMAAPALAQGGPVPVVVSIASERLLAPVTPYPGTVISRSLAILTTTGTGPPWASAGAAMASWWRRWGVKSPAAPSSSNWMP